MTQIDTKKPSTTEQPVYNSVQFRGHIGKDPQQASDNAPVTFDLAVPQGKDKPKMWLTVKCWGELRTSILANEGICKGAQVEVHGRLTSNKYQEKVQFAVVASVVELVERSKKP